jgi:uncharacterized membrane protein YeaQ/YmgE (transglycosylase-associated protein family)
MREDDEVSDSERFERVFKRDLIIGPVGATVAGGLLFLLVATDPRSTAQPFIEAVLSGCALAAYIFSMAG